MKYQLVIQFAEESIEGFDHLIKIEDLLIDNLEAADVDGHDVGSGEMNIFIFTDRPVDTFSHVKKLLAQDIDCLQTMKAAYRDVESEDYNILWPKDLTEFEVR